MPPTQESSAKLPLFDIEKDGDPRISWCMYYDFVVTETGAYYQLQSGYLETQQYPSRVKSQNVLIGGKEHHRCQIVDCKAEPFARYHDLKRHFRTIHQNDEHKIYCDYKKCPNKDAFRKDHLRVHYRHYHNEDLIKHTKGEHDRGQNAEEFLATCRNADINWWRCYKCVQRVKVQTDDYMCPGCTMPCEPERVAWRQKTFASEGFPSQCENM